MSTPSAPPPPTPPVPDAQDAAPGAGSGRSALIVFAWLWVSLPLAYGIYELVRKATQLFTG